MFSNIYYFVKQKKKNEIEKCEEENEVWGAFPQFLLFHLNRLFLCNALRLQWFAMWMLPICIATLPPASWLAVEAPPPSVFLHLLLSLFFLLRTSSGTVLPMLCACKRVFCPGLYSGAVAAIAQSHREQKSVDGERVCDLAQLAGAITQSTVRCRICPTRRWDTDLTMVPFLRTSSEITGGEKQRKTSRSFDFAFKILIFYSSSTGL